MGGLSRKAFQISTITQYEKLPAIIVDAGNLLFEPGAAPTAQDKITATGITEILQTISYDAIAVGPYDMAAGVDFLLKSQERGFPWLSANIINHDGKPVFKPSMSISRSGLSIGIIGLTGFAGTGSPSMHIAKWHEVLPAHLPALSKSTDLIILLSSLDQDENTEIIRRYPEIDILITADCNLGNIQPKIIGNTMVTQTQSQGKYLGKLLIDWLPGHPWLQDFSAKEIELQDQLGIIDRRILRIEKLRGKTGINVPEQVLALRREREQVEKKLSALRDQKKERERTTQQFSAYNHSFIVMNSDLPNNQKISEQINQVKKKIAESYQ